MKALIAILIALLVTPTRAEQPVNPKGPDKPQETWLPVCIVAAAGLAVAGIYIISKKCKPKYYWLADEEQPPTTWVGAATDRECRINGWHKIGGPYDSPQEAPTNAPPLTNIVSRAFTQPMNITVEQTTDLQNWTPVYSEFCDTEDFAYFPTNAVGGMFRISVAP